MEFKRIYSKKHLYILFLFLILCNSFIFTKEQKDKILENDVSLQQITDSKKEYLDEYKNMPIEQAYKDISLRIDELQIISSLINYRDMEKDEIKEYEEIFEEEYNNLRGRYPELTERVNKNHQIYNDKYIYIEYNSLNSIKKSIEYILEYPEYFRNIDKQKEELSQISIMQSKFALLNAASTKDDFENIRDLPLELGMDDGFTSFVSFKLTPYLIFILLIFIILDFTYERENDIWKVVYSTPNGRGVLALNRLFILVFSVVCLSLLFYLSLLSISMKVYGGREDLDRYVQSIASFQEFTVPMTVMKFIGYYLLINILSILVISLLFWLLLTIVNSHKLGLLFFILFMIVEWSFYTFTSNQSAFSLLKYINFYAYINMATDMIKYLNTAVFSGLLNKNIILLISLIFFLCLLLFLCIYLNSKINPCHCGHIYTIKTKLTKLVSKVKDKFYEKLGFVGMELYKILIHQKGLLIIIILVFALQYNSSDEKIYFSDSDYIVNDFYDMYSGELTQDTKNYINEWQNKIWNPEQSIHTFNPNLLISEQKAISKVINHVDYLENLKDTKGIEGWLVNPRSYNHLFGNDYYSKQIVYDVLALIFLVFALSAVFSYEEKNNVKTVIHTTANGRVKLFMSKIISVIILTTIIWGLVYGAQLLEINKHYNFTNLEAPVQSLDFFENINIKCSLGDLIFIVSLLRLFVLILISFIICYISNRVSLIKTIIISIVIFLIPEFLSNLTIPIFNYISAIRIINVTSVLLVKNGFIIMLIYIAILVVLGLIVLYKTKKNWCNNKKQKGE